MNAEQLVTLVKAILADIKAQDVVALDVTNMTSVADHIVIASGTSSRHVKSIADRVLDGVRAAVHPSDGHVVGRARQPHELLGLKLGDGDPADLRALAHRIS